MDIGRHTPTGAFASNVNNPGVWSARGIGAGRGVYPIIDDADPYGVGSSGPAVPAGSGLTAPASNSRNAVSFSSARTTKRFPSSRCASAIQIVRPLESTVDRNRAGSRLLFLAEFLEARIIPERIEHRIEPEQRGSERHVCNQCAVVRYRE